MGLRGATGMGDRTLLGRSHRLLVTPERTGLEVVLAGLPLLAAGFQLLFRKLDIEHTLLCIDDDDVAVAQQSDGPADCRLGTYMPDTEAAGGTGKAPVGDQRHLVSHALPVDRCGGRQHLAHTRAAFRPFVADDEDVAFLVAALLNRLESLLFTVEDQGRAPELQVG